MHKLPKPSDEHNAPFVPVQVFDLCISKIKRGRFLSALQSIRNDIASTASNYNVLAEQSKLYQLTPQTSVGPVKVKEMESLYTDRFAKEKHPARRIYDRIKAAPENQCCPLCGLGIVTTLDHYLPKSKYPIFAVTPNNLIPCCWWCQFEKREHRPAQEEDQTLHPYFDDFQTENWLFAEIVQGTPASFHFSVKAPHVWGQVAAKRLKTHFDKFNLGNLYSSNAGSELAGMRDELQRLLTSGGPASVQKHLEAVANDKAKLSKNSWKAAMYRAAASDVWFYSGGFALK